MATGQAVSTSEVEIVGGEEEPWKVRLCTGSDNRRFTDRRYRGEKDLRLRCEPLRRVIPTMTVMETAATVIVEIEIAKIGTVEMRIETEVVEMMIAEAEIKGTEKEETVTEGHPTGVEETTAGFLSVQVEARAAVRRILVEEAEAAQGIRLAPQGETKELHT